MTKKEASRCARGSARTAAVATTTGTSPVPAGASDAGLVWRSSVMRPNHEVAGKMMSLLLTVEDPNDRLDTLALVVRVWTDAPRNGHADWVGDLTGQKVKPRRGERVAP